MLEALRRKWVRQLGGENATSFVIDTKPIPVMGYRRSKRHSDFHGSAGYGYCSARKMKYFGYKLVMLSTLKGLPVAYELVSARDANASPVVLRRSAPVGAALTKEDLLKEFWRLFVIVMSTETKVSLVKTGNSKLPVPQAIVFGRYNVKIKIIKFLLT